MLCTAGPTLAIPAMLSIATGSKKCGFQHGCYPCWRGPASGNLTISFKVTAKDSVVTNSTSQTRGMVEYEGPAPWAYYSPAAAYVLHSGDQGSVVRRERSAPSGWGHRPRRPSPGIPPAHGGSSSHRRMRPESRRRQEQQASPVCAAPAKLRNLAA